MAPSVLGLFWEETLSNFGGARYRWLFESEVVAGRAVRRQRDRFVRGRFAGQAKASGEEASRWTREAVEGSRTLKVQYCWSQSTRVVSFYERQKRRCA